MTYLEFEAPPLEGKQDQSNGLKAILKNVFISVLKRIIPMADPDYEDKIDLVKTWLLEISDHTKLPNREIGLDEAGQVIVRLPYGRNYGYWTDNHLTLKDFENQFSTKRISETDFERYWNALSFPHSTTTEDEVYGIDKNHAHPTSIALIPDAFFWDNTDPLAPFGSDEGDMALAEFRDWRKANPKASVLRYVQEVIEQVGEMKFADYNDRLLDPQYLQQQLNDDAFDQQQYLFTLDISVIATGFGQLVDEGTIDQDTRPSIQLAIHRQKTWTDLRIDWPYQEQYLSHLQVLENVLKKL